MHEYRPGRWTALVADDALAVFHPDLPDAVARELWQLASEGRRLGAWVEYLAAAGIATLPSFAMVESHPDGARVLVRGELTVAVDGRELSGRGYTTWREELVTTSQPVLVTAEDDDGAWLPVTGGIVRAGQVRATVSAGAPPAAVEDDDVEHTVARMPALAAAVGSSAAAAAAGAPSADAPAAPTTAAAPDPEFAPRTPAEARPTPEHTQEPPAAPEPAAERTAPEEPTAAPEPAAERTAPEEPVDVESTDDDYDFLLWPTEQSAAAGAASEGGSADPAASDPAPGETAQQPAGASTDHSATGAAPVGAPATDERTPATPVTGWSPEQPPADSGQVDLEATRAPEPEEDHEQGGIIDSVPGRLAPPTGSPVAPPPGTPQVPGGPVAATDDGDHDGQTILTSELPGAPAASPAPAAPGVPALEPARTELLLSTGERVEMARPVLIGRAPEAGRFAGNEVPRLMSVPNPDVSGTHVEIRPAGGHVVVTDMNSTNGTVLHRPDQPAVRLQPGTGVPVAPGAVIEIGEGLTIRVEPIEASA